MTKSSVSGDVGTPGDHEWTARPCGGAEPVEVARWRAAEEHLYPLIVIDPDAYEAAVTLVGEMVEVLCHQCDTVAELAEVDGATVLDRFPSMSVLTDLGVDPATTLDAARACRWRQLTMSQPRIDGPGSGGRR
jgi:hypothetical protein